MAITANLKSYWFSVGHRLTRGIFFSESFHFFPTCFTTSLNFFPISSTLFLLFPHLISSPVWILTELFSYPESREFARIYTPGWQARNFTDVYIFWYFICLRALVNTPPSFTKTRKVNKQTNKTRKTNKQIKQDKEANKQNDFVYIYPSHFVVIIGVWC